MLVVFITDKAFFLVKNTAPEMVQDKRLNDLFEGKVNKDLIIIGSSRGTADIATWMLEDSLGMSAFNLSYGGSEIEWQLFILETLLEKASPPRIIVKIIDDPFELTKAKINEFRLDVLYPLVKYPRALEALIERGEKNRFLSKLLVTHQLSKTSYDFRAPPPVQDSVLLYGALPRRGQISEKQKKKVRIDTSYYASNELPGKVDAFMKFKDITKNKGIQVVYVIPPSYSPLNEDFVIRMRTMIGPDNTFFIYDREDSSYFRDAFFRDPYHLNIKGAEYFTNDLVCFMKDKLDY
jgi:hypothetical protein